MPEKTWLAVSAEDSVRREEEFDRKIAAYDRTGTHLWMIIMGFVVETPDGDMVKIGTEQLSTVTPVGCYLCEEPYSKVLAKQRCTGLKNPG